MMAEDACRLERSEGCLVAAIRLGGPARDVGGRFDHLMHWAEVHRIEHWGPLVGVYLDPLPGAPEVSGEAWLPIPPDLRGMDPGDGQVAIKEVASQEVARCTHRGFPDGLGIAVRRLAQWVVDEGLQRSEPLHRQVYRHAPKGDPGSWVVDVELPVARRGG